MIRAEEQLELKIHKNWGIFFSPISINIILKYKFISPELWYNVCVPISLWPHLTVLTDYNFICPLIPGFYSIPCLIHSYGTTRTNMCTTPTPRLMNLWRILMPSPYNLLQTFLHNFIFKPIFSNNNDDFCHRQKLQNFYIFCQPTLIINSKTKVWIKVVTSIKTLRKTEQN